MNRIEACRILGISGNCDPAEVKKRYRRLMHLVHPDAEAFRRKNRQSADNRMVPFDFLEDAFETGYPYGIQEIQAAYAVLAGSEKEEDSSFSERTASGQDEDAWKKRDPAYAKAVWNAEENPEAFCEREILQTIEDFDGNILGDFTLTRGRFLWQPEEEFFLFLKSLSKATDRLILQAEEEAEQQIYGPGRDPWQDFRYADTEAERELLKPVLKEKLTYLLAQQFIDAANTLRQLTRTKELNGGEETVYYIPAMLEKEFCRGKAEPGDTLYPHQVTRHRLYVKDSQGEAAGYLSFPDDRMYYLVIPLFEQRRVQVKIKVPAPKEGDIGLPGRGRRNAVHTRISLWIRFKKTASGIPENLSSQIGSLLEEYRNQLLDCFTGAGR